VSASRGPSPAGHCAARAEGPVPLFEWSSNEIDPTHGRYLHFDGAAGFRRVLANRAVAGTGSDPLRWYRDGPGRAIVGTSAWTRARLGPPVATSTLDAPLRYQVVDHRAAAAPWAVVHGRVSLPPGRRVVLAANGVVAGVYTTQGPVVGGRTDFSGMVAPVLRDGHNLIQLFAAEGSDTAPVLRLIRIAA
jgi:hypothetical protein